MSSNPNETKQAFAIEGMHCNSCAITIDWEIEDVEGVVDSDTSYPKARAEVVFDASKASQSDILAAIERAGFKAQPA